MKGRCGECGSRKIKYLPVKKGEHFSWRSIPRVPIIIDVDLLTCQDCGNLLLGPGDCQRLDKAIEKSLEILCENYLLR